MLMAISLDGAVPWISGYLEFTFASATGPTASQSEQMMRLGLDASRVAALAPPLPPSSVAAASASADAAPAPALAPRRLQGQTTTVTPEFHVSLTMVHRIANFPMWYSGVQAWSDEAFTIADFITDVNVAIGGSPPGNRWVTTGVKPLNVGVFQATVGLIGFAAFIQFLVWLTLVMISYDAPGVSNNKGAFAFTKFGSAAAAFFCTVALISFDASQYMLEWCKAYDPDATTNGKGCGYGDGFGLIVAASLACIAHTLLMFFVVPEHVAAAYAFAGGAASGAGAKLASGGYTEVGVSSGGGGGGDSGSSGSSGGASFQGSFQSTAL